MRRTTRKDISDLLTRLGIQKGDTIFLHSALYTLGYIEGGLETVHASIIDAIGENGTLLVPTFTYSFRRSEKFDIRHSPAALEVGAYSEFVRTQTQSKRSACPLFSIAGIGPQADSLTRRRSNQCFGEGSVLDQVFEANVLFVALGVPWSRGLSGFMHLEKLAQVPYRIDLPLHGISTDRNGEEFDDMAVHFARNEAEYPHDFADRDEMGQLLENRGACQTVGTGQQKHKAIRAHDWREIVLEVLRSDPFYMYKHNPETMAGSQIQ